VPDLSHGPMVAGQPAADRLMGSLRPLGGGWVAFPSERQVAMVLHALADYTALMEAWRVEEGDPDPALAAGRWLHAVADDLERR
jgi:hypothetical protein